MTQASDEIPASPATARTTLRVVFVTLFLDLIGFSIIFPLFPGMLEYYSAQSPPSPLFGALYGLLEHMTATLGVSGGHWGIIVLFGGVLGSLYSLLQFVGAPIFGAVSDQIGRRPVMLLSLCGIFVSYLIWFFAGSFGLLVAARLLGGIMSANISTATAVVADTTTEENRSRGMAIIGIAFGLGFILGPAIGGVTASIDLSAHFPGLVAYGLNPFSAPAAAALLLTAFNLVYAYFRLPETLRKSGAPRPVRSANPLALLRTESYPGVSRTNLTYFLFLLAFSGMEFSLTFLAHERLSYGARQNAYMFLFIGAILVAIQGGYVRRRSASVGPRRMALHGLGMVIPALMVVGLAAYLRSSLVLYVGLLFLAAGAAQATPCLTALASMYTPKEEQGRVLGIFRSLGALARAIGPLLAAALYWWIGPTLAYFLGGLFVLVPLVMAAGLPKSPEAEPGRA
jgi:MFS family permease